MLKMNTANSLGKVYLVGAGPGAADLITVRGAKLLAQADIVFHDALVEPEMFAIPSHKPLSQAPYSPTHTPTHTPTHNATHTFICLTSLPQHA